MFWEIFVLLILLSIIVWVVGVPGPVIGSVWFCIITTIVGGILIGIGVQISYIWFPIAAPIIAVG